VRHMFWLSKVLVKTSATGLHHARAFSNSENGGPTTSHGKFSGGRPKIARDFRKPVREDRSAVSSVDGLPNTDRGICGHSHWKARGRVRSRHSI
jgi:hypothetical protein